ncbi:MAG: hypothetical protein ABIE70_02175 [bacterium]
MSRVFVVLVAMLLVVVLAGSCDRSSDNQCRTFSTASGSFDECTWKLSQADELCVQLGFKNFWGDMKDTTCSGSDTAFIVSLTCCTK